MIVTPSGRAPHETWRLPLDHGSAPCVDLHTTRALPAKRGTEHFLLARLIVPRGAPVAPTALILGAIFLGEGIVWLAAVVVLGDRLSVVVNRASVRRRMERLTGLVMIGFGLRLALERR